VRSGRFAEVAPVNSHLKTENENDEFLLLDEELDLCNMCNGANLAATGYGRVGLSPRTDSSQPDTR
jgi:hypothetical protein